MRAPFNFVLLARAVKSQINFRPAAMSLAQDRPAQSGATVIFFRAL
jgi:hypothetical protein